MASEGVPTSKIIEAMLSVQLSAALEKIEKDLNIDVERMCTLILQNREVNEELLQVRQYAQLVYNSQPITDRLGVSQIRKLMGGEIMYRNEKGFFFQLRVSMAGLGFDDDLRELGLLPPKVVEPEPLGVSAEDLGIPVEDLTSPEESLEVVKEPLHFSDGNLPHYGGGTVSG